MGCITSKNANLAAKRQELEREAAARRAAEKRLASEKRAADQAAADRLSRPQSRVEKQLSMYEKLENDARKQPELQQVQGGVIGQRSAKLLEGYEQKEKDAKAVPELVRVDRKDIRSGTMFRSLLGDYEKKDADAAAEPKLEKTFVQREKESLQRLSDIERAADAPLAH